MTDPLSSLVQRLREPDRYGQPYDDKCEAADAIERLRAIKCEHGNGPLTCPECHPEETPAHQCREWRVLCPTCHKEHPAMRAVATFDGMPSCNCDIGNHNKVAPNNCPVHRPIILAEQLAAALGPAQETAAVPKQRFELPCGCVVTFPANILLVCKDHAPETAAVRHMVCGECQQKATVSSTDEFKLIALVCDRALCPGRNASRPAEETFDPTASKDHDLARSEQKCPYPGCDLPLWTKHHTHAGPAHG
jgi:Zn finger protein HypA/HybF involved in hydrogenase expression